MSVFFFFYVLIHLLQGTRHFGTIAMLENSMGLNFAWIAMILECLEGLCAETLW